MFLRRRDARIAIKGKVAGYGILIFTRLHDLASAGR